MLSCWITTVHVIATVFTVVSGTCPYVGNYYYSYNNGATYVTGALHPINECLVDNDEIDGNTYDSEKFTCLNNEVYINKYVGENCAETAGFTAKLEAIQSNGAEKVGQYIFSCEQSTGCTNYVDYIISNQSWIKYLNLETPTNCPDYSNDNFIQVFPSKIITDTCIDTTNGNLSVPDTSSKWLCDSTGMSWYNYVGSTECVGNPTNIEKLNNNGCAEGNSQIVGLYGKMTYCNGVSYNGGPNTASPTLMTPGPTPWPTLNTPSPTASSNNPSNAPTSGTGTPTQNPTHTPTTVTSGPSTSPTENTYSPTENTNSPTELPLNVPNPNGSAMFSCSHWIMFIMLYSLYIMP